MEVVLDADVLDRDLGIRRLEVDIVYHKLRTQPLIHFGVQLCSTGQPFVEVNYLSHASQPPFTLRGYRLA